MEEQNNVQLTPEEQTAVDGFTQSVRQDPNLICVSDEMLVQCMMARKFEGARAHELLLNSMPSQSYHHQLQTESTKHQPFLTTPRHFHYSNALSSILIVLHKAPQFYQSIMPHLSYSNRFKRFEVAF